MAEASVTLERLKKALEALTNSIPGEVFTVADAEEVLGLSKRSVSFILKGLADKGLIVRTGRGTYSIHGKPIPMLDVETLPETSRTLHEALSSEGILFALSCLDILSGFTHLAIRRFPNFLWVEGGSEDWAMEVASKVGFTPIREPTSTQLPVALEFTADANPVIIRKTSIFYATKGGLARVERALVDLHYEVTRERYPLDGGELMRIFYYALTTISIDFPKLLRYSGMRHLRHEIKWILWQLKGKAEIPNAYLEPKPKPNKFVHRLPNIDEALRR